MRYQDLKEDTEKDMSAAQQARSAFAVIHDYIKDNIDKPNMGLQMVKDGKHLLLLFKDLPNSQKWADMAVVFGKQTSDEKGRFGTFGENTGLYKNGIPYGMFLFVLIREGDTEYLDTRMTGVRDTFIHEFTHYLDMKRDTRHPHDMLSNMERIASQSDEEYYSDPSEYNAFYQSGVGDLMNTLEHGDKVLKKQVFYNFKDFMALWMPLYWDKHYLKNMNPKFRRKFDKRMAVLWHKLKKDYDR